MKSSTRIGALAARASPGGRVLALLLALFVAAGVVILMGAAVPSEAQTVSMTYTVKDLGTLPGGSNSYAFGINDSGQVVGRSDTSSRYAHAFLYSNGQMQDLNSLIPVGSGWILREAWGINTSGQIVGWGVINGHSRAFLATPGTAPPDTMAPTVTRTAPKANANEVAPTANVRATFSEEMNSDTIDGQIFQLFKKGTTTQIAAQVSYNADTDTAKLDPTSNLRRGVAYKAVVSTWAKDAAGNRLDQNSSTTGLQQKVWYFTVDD